MRPFKFDRKTLAVVILLVSLGGLGYIQYRMLSAYYTLSREKLDQQISATLEQTGEETYDRTLLSNLISAIVTGDTVSFPVGIDSLRSAGTRFYKMYLTDRFSRANLPAGFEFAVLDQLTGEVFLASENYAGGAQWIGNYNLPLEGIIARDCACAPYLNVRFNRIESILLQGLGPIFWPALVCFVLLIVGFYLLLRILREQHYLDRVKNDFINNLTHELKTPVFSISLAARMMREKQEEDISPYLDRMERDIAQLKGNVEQVLELASIEDRHSLLHLEKVEVGEFMERWREGLKGHPDASRLQWQLSDTGAKILADPLHLRNALNNLVDNALKYSREEVLITVEVLPREVVWRVRDQGSGIDKVHQEAIFTKFYRVNNGGGNVRGYGLGLSYVRQVVEMMKGSVAVVSQAGKGSTFEIKLNKA